MGKDQESERELRAQTRRLLEQVRLLQRKRFTRNPPQVGPRDAPGGERAVSVGARRAGHGVRLGQG